MAARFATARVAGVAVALTLVVGPVLSGCSTPARGATAARAPATPPASAAADSFHSPRTHQTVALPVRIRIPAIGVNSVLERLGRLADGSIDLPHRQIQDAGWYREGPRPGQPGPAVIIGHVDWDHGPAVFFDLDQLRPGDQVYVDRADGSVGRFRVTGMSQVPKVRFPTDLVFGQNLEVSLRLVTCGGSFDRTTRNYRDNVIVFASPA